jgi:hypothetical protein
VQRAKESDPVESSASGRVRAFFNHERHEEHERKKLTHFEVAHFRKSQGDGM